MKLSKYRMAKQRGFSIITGFILAIVLFGALAFFLAGRGINTGFGANYANMSKVSGFLSQVGYVATGFDAVLLNGTPAASITFDTTATTGIFNPTTGGVTPQTLDPSLFLAPAAGIRGYLVYRTGIVLTDVGTAAAEYTLVTSGLKLSTCQAINNILHGTALTDPAPVLDPMLEAGLVGAPTLAAPTSAVAADLSALATTPAISRRMNGCYATSDATAVHVYIHTLLVQ